MASKHDSKAQGTGTTSGQKRPITYGKTPRKRLSSDPSRAIESTTSPRYAPKSQDNTATRPSDTSSKNNRHWVPRSPRDTVEPSASKQNRTSNHETPRKRKRSSPAFAPVSPTSSQALRGNGSESAATSTPRLQSSQAREGSRVARDLKFATGARTAENMPSGPAPSAKPAIDTEPRGKAQDRPSSTKRRADGAYPSKPRRTRLIDTLAAQRADSSDSDLEAEIEPSGGERPPFHTPIEGTRTPPPQHRPPVIGRDARVAPANRVGDSSKGRKIKFTYGQARTIRNEPRPGDAGTDDVEVENDALFSESLLPDPLVPSSQAAFAFPDDDGEDDAQLNTGIKSVHELRRAGANHRFADEMEDMLSRIGTPGRNASSMRRNALLELAQKLRHEDFASQFRDHATRDNVAMGIGAEEDVINGFSLAAVLVLFLSSGTAPHLLQQLDEDRVGKLLARLLCIRDDIDDVASQRKMNVSRASRASLHEVKSQLLQMRLWHGYSPTSLSPRSVALQLLDFLMRWSNVRSLEEVTKDLDADLAVAAGEYSAQSLEADADFALIVRVFEAQSSISTAPDTEATRTRLRSSTVAGFLQRALRRWPDDHGELESTIFRLAINTANTAGGAEAFDEGCLLSDLASGICKGFRLVQEAVDRQSLQGGTYDELLLMLGVMINVLEHCSRARCSVDRDSLDKLVTVYLGTHTSIAEANSVDTSKLDVASGYLAVLLGYLSLAAPVQNIIKARAQGRENRNLVESIQEFIVMYKNVDSKVHELEGLVAELRGQLV